jgi:hypothetical protein
LRIVGGAVEVGTRALSTDRRGASAWLVLLWVFGRDQRLNFVAFVGYLVLQGFRFIPTMRSLPARSLYFRWFLVSTPAAVFPILNAAVLAIRAGD